METQSAHPKPRFCLALALLASTVAAPAALTTFSYTQTDNVTGAGTIAAPAPTNFGGVTITWAASAMPAASVRDPSGGGAAGAVGGFNEQEGNNGGNGRDVAIYWNSSTLTTSGASVAAPLSVTLSGSGDDGNSYSVSLPLVFFGDNVLPDEHIAGWGNTRSVLRKRVKGAGSNVFETQVGKTVENNKWYAIKIEVSPDKVVGYLNREKGFEVKEGPAEGRIGFSLFGTSVAFDDIVVYDKDGLSVDSSEKLATFWGQIRRQK